MSLAKSGKLNLEAMVLPANSHRSHWRSIWKQFLYVGYKDEPYEQINFYWQHCFSSPLISRPFWGWIHLVVSSLPCFRSGSTISSTGTAPSRNTFAFSLKSADNQPRIIWKRKRTLLKYIQSKRCAEGVKFLTEYVVPRYGGVESIRIHPRLMWTPDLLLYNRFFWIERAGVNQYFHFSFALHSVLFLV